VVQLRIAAGLRETSSPSMARRSTRAGRSSPEMMRSIVVLPEPLSPRMVRNSPRPAESDTSSTARVGP
jgi:hypothetical protein